MRFMKSVSPQSAMVYALFLGVVALPCLVPCSMVAARASAEGQAEAKLTIITGKFGSFKDGVLKVSVPGDRSEVAKDYEWKVTEDVKVVSHIRGTAKEGTSRDAFKLWESGAIIAVKLIDSKVTFVELGKPNPPAKVPENATDKTSQTAKTEWGRFVSFRDGTLTIKSNADDCSETKLQRTLRSWCGMTPRVCTSPQPVPPS